MKIEKEYRRLENVVEIRIHDINEKELYKPTPLEFHVDEVPFHQLISNFQRDVDILIPHNGGNDFIIKSLGEFILNRGNLHWDDVIEKIIK